MINDSFNETNKTLYSVNDNDTVDQNDVCHLVLPLRISSLVFSFTVSVFLLYLMTALCYYGFRNKMMLGCRDPSLYPRNQTKSIINFVTLWCAIFVFVHVAVKLPLIFPPLPNFCEIYHRIKITSFALATICSYFTLWYRVFTVFYKDKSMRKRMSKTMHVAVILPLVLLFLMVVTSLSIFLFGPSQKNSFCGCVAVQDTTGKAFKWTMLAFWTLSFQGTLLFSFIYPLYLHRKNMLSRGFDHRLIIPVVKRAAIVAVVCVVSDLFNSAFGIFYKSDTVYLNHIVVSLNLLVNLMGVVMSFSNWKEKIFPWRKQTMNEEVSKSQPSLIFNVVKQITDVKA